MFAPGTGHIAPSRCVHAGCSARIPGLWLKTSAVGAWSYPDFAYTKLFGVPLFSGFMYAAVGSYVIQAWRLFELRVRHHPPYWMAWLIAFAIYANFFTHHYIGDFRWYIVACALGLYARATVTFIPLHKKRIMPLLLSFVPAPLVNMSRYDSANRGRAKCH